MKTKAELESSFVSALQSMESILLPIGEETANLSFRSGGWTRKQILGHLCDSAAINRVRLVRGILDDHFDGADYQQERWVELQGYLHLPWKVLVSLWRTENRVLSQLVQRTTEKDLQKEISVGGQSYNISAWIEDYLAHLLWHGKQIAEAGR